MGNTKTTKTGLVLQGGGARGAYQVGALRAIADMRGSHKNPFPIISGTSVGAINTSSLASMADDFIEATNRLEKLWLGLNSHSIFDARTSALLGTVWRIVRTFGFGGKTNRYGLLDNRPLQHLLENEFSRKGVEAGFKSGALEALCITTSCYACGMAVTFYESTLGVDSWVRARREGRAAKISVDHMMASSALPVIFPAVKIEGTYHGDGAMRLTTPLSPAIRLGADKALIIGVRDAHVASQLPEFNPPYPSVGEMAGHALDILFNDNLDSDVERVNRINNMLKHMTTKGAKEMDLRPVDMFVLQPSQDLRLIAQEHEHEMPRALRFVLKSMGATHSDGRIPSYLLFEPGYIRALIKLGYDDAMARADELKEFLTD